MTCHVNVDCDGYAIEMHAAETSNLSGKGIQGVMAETKVLRSKKYEKSMCRNMKMC